MTTTSPQPSCLDGVLEDARGSFREHGVARIEGAISDGLAAELAHYLPTLPCEPRQNPAHGDLSWACEMGVPEDYDPQHPACVYRLLEFLDHELPEIASAVSGSKLAPVMARRVHVWIFRRGAHVDDAQPLAPAGGVDVILGLTAPRWPAAWGGHLDTGQEPQRLGFGTLTLLRRGFRIPLLTHHVQALAVRSILRPA